MKKNSIKKIGVILMTYGSPKTLDDVPQYLKNVFGGKNPDSEIIAEFQRRYKLIGGSPLIKITKMQAMALEKELNRGKKEKIFFVTAGMRFSPPFIKDVILDLGKKVDTVVGIIMSPQYSKVIMSGYIRELGSAVEKLPKKVELKMATDWHSEPYFLMALANRVKEALDLLPKKYRKTTPILFSAHSMPKRVIDKEPQYIEDLKDTAYRVAKLLGLSKKQWLFCYQSAGHSPEEWLKPDFADIMPLLAKQTHVIIAPVQFLADHLEILYDVEIAAREQAEKYGIHFSRIESLNTSPIFIQALSNIVNSTLNFSATIK